MRLALFLLAIVGFAISSFILAAAMNFGLVPCPLRTLTFPEQNCSCQIPYIWIVRDQHQVLLRAHNLFSGTFSLSARNYPTAFDVTSPSYAAAITSRLEKDGFQVTEQDTQPFQDHPSFSYTLTKSLFGKVAYERVTTFMVGTMHYTLLIAKSGSDPAQDPQLVAAENSFRLLNARK